MCDKYNNYFSPNQRREGYGIIIYIQVFKNNLIDGLGRLIISNGDYYEGEFLKDKKFSH